MGNLEKNLRFCFAPRKSLSQPPLQMTYGSTNYTIWLFNIAMGNDPFIDGLPIKNGDFPWLC
jgi:hypothetical protein